MVRKKSYIGKWMVTHSHPLKEKEEKMTKYKYTDCGYETKEGEWEEIENHLKECSVHPLRKGEARVKELEKGIEELIAYGMPPYIEEGLKKIPISLDIRFLFCYAFQWSGKNGFFIW